VASTLQALATPSRLLILSRLRQAPCSVTELAEAVDMQQSAISHQLRLLRNLGLVTGTRAGQRIVYGLHDHHVAMLLEQAIYHSEHLRLGLRDPPIRVAGPLPHPRPTRGAVKEQKAHERVMVLFR
jgi:DNA-binding transcriptional ArsR family regulator